MDPVRFLYHPMRLLDHREMEYKFFLDDQKVEETSEAGTQCTKTTDIYTNRLANITKDTSSLDVVCFNTCSGCE